ncbi:MAG TPA: DNA polymerase III subunit alpha, partial [Desulfotomaculum sp.]|nr:DNA polymerase III subunit alpha [Desulfotomaculum sp.]
PGRGSAAGSLAAYLLGITSLDPLKYGLLFERFLNPERISLPDVDIDFCFERRSAVIDYIINKYGVDHVAQIVTFGTMMARAAIRDVGRVMDIPYSEVDQVAKLIPAEFHITIEKALRESTELNELYQQDERVKQLIDTAVMLEGMPRHASTHAAGIVITPEPLTNYLPLYKSTDGPLTTQFTKDQVEELGLLKIDLLGLRTLTVISDTIRLIGEGDGPGINIDQIPLDDPKTFVLLSQGESIGVFQLESSGMRTLLKDLRPQHFEDLVALVALYRPGPLGSGMVEDFIKRKHGEKKVVYLHPKLETILNDTYGIILYQEQVMRIASELAGFTLSEADLLRRAMGKKKPEIIAGLRAQFIGGAGKNGLSNSISAQIFDLMEYFAGYGFNKSHSAAYALVAYQTAFLKANYPAEYMAALLTSVKDNTDKIAVYIEECRRLRIEVLPPDINESQKDFAPAQNKIRFGLAAIKNVGLTATEAIIKSRQKEGHFQSYADFCRRLDTRIINKRVLESLIKCGAFDSLGNRRAQLMAAVDIGLGLAQAAQRERSHGQLSLLDFLDGGAQKNLLELPDLAEYPKQELLTMEKESLGLYISGHPLTEYRQSLAEYTTTCLAEVREIKDEVPARNQAGGKDDSSVLSVGGMLTSLKKVNTRRNETMAFGTLEDLTGSLEVVFFPRVYQKYVSFLKTEAIVLVKGRVNTGNEDNKVICEELSLLPKKANASLYLKLENEKRSPHLIAQTQGILRSFPGKSPVYLFFPEEKKMVLTGQDYWVNLSGPVIAELKNLLGSTNVKIKNNET